MTKLSPAAQAVLDAFGNASDGEYVDGVWVVNERTMLAAALRAAADQVVPEESTKQKMFMWQRERLEQRLMTRKRILAIADNLEAQ